MSGSIVISGAVRPGAHAGVLAIDLSDHSADLRIYLTAGGLALLGLLLAVGTVWWWRATRREVPSLAPLEMMSDRRWREAGDGERQRLLEEHRPFGAMVAPAEPVRPGPIDLAVLAQAAPVGFDDLREQPYGDEVEFVVDAAPADGVSPEAGTPGVGDAASTAGASTMFDFTRPVAGRGAALQAPYAPQPARVPGLGDGEVVPSDLWTEILAPPDSGSLRRPMAWPKPD